MSLLKQANAAFLARAWPTAAQKYWQAAVAEPGLRPFIEQNLYWLRQYWLHERTRKLAAGEPPKVAVSCWELAHNPAGRSYTLLEAWQPMAPNVEMIGCIFPNFGRTLWQPLTHLRFSCHYVTCEHEPAFMQQAVTLVMQRPYDLVHVSKPRMPSLLFARLYQLIWGTRIILDIDDEELAFTGKSKLDTTPPSDWTDFRKTAWTHWAVSQIQHFDSRTVSNPALQAQYGGQLLPHVRPLERFRLPRDARAAARQRWDIPMEAKVVLFAGTPRQHKGLLETARALAGIGQPNTWLVVVGDFPKGTESLKDRLQNMVGLHCRFIPNQPYTLLPATLVLGDITVLLQDAQSVVAQYQLPAKLMDALAMGLTVLATPTPAIAHLVEEGVVTPITEETLWHNVRNALAQLGTARAKQQAKVNQQYFAQHLSVTAVQHLLGRLQQSAQSDRIKPPDWAGQLNTLIEAPAAFLLPDQIG